MKLIFATNNPNKVKEIHAVLPSFIEVVSLKDAGIDIEIPEPHPTLEENAAEKARTIHNLSKTDCFSEDTGLEVYALQMEPGVHSARYAGEPPDFERNIIKLLERLKGNQNRKARFRTVICLMLEGTVQYFEGTCEGYITASKKGKNGFGYDPVFIPEGSTQTFAEMELAEKSRYSHRSKAVAKLVAFLNESNVKA